MDSLLIRQVDQRFHRASSPTERWSSARFLTMGNGLGKELGHNRSNRSAVSLSDSLDLFQNEVVNVEIRLHDACCHCLRIWCQS